MRLQHALLSTCVNPNSINTLLSKAAGKMTNINIDVTADILCPWVSIPNQSIIFLPVQANKISAT
jgi:hypothetical protein